MDLKSLPMDADTMLAGLKRWVECESPTYDPAAVSRMVALASEDMRAMGASVEPIAGPAGLGDCARAAFPHERSG